MNNYQLYRTNVFLGGQMKWDLTVESDGNELCVNDFHLSPVSDYIPFSRKADEFLLKSRHLDNIKTYYKSIEGSFFKEGLDPIVSTKEPLIVDDMNNIHDNLVDLSPCMGLKRSHIRVTGKQLEFFCPLWLEDYDPLKHVLAFEFQLSPVDRKTHKINSRFITKTLKLRPVNNDQSLYHNKFVAYFNDYIESLKLDDNICKVDFTGRTVIYSGINVKTGTASRMQYASDLADRLLSHEHMLMDTDQMLINTFNQKHMIARQLFNFNFVFNADELIPHWMIEDMFGADINISVRAIIGDRIGKKVVYRENKYLEMKDFSSNYDYIECKPSGIAAKMNRVDGKNVFDLLVDHRDVNILSKNRVQQNIIHWALTDNNDYVFNLYSGFGGYNKFTGDGYESYSTSLHDKTKNIKDVFDQKVAAGQAVYLTTVNTVNIEWAAVKAGYEKRDKIDPSKLPQPSNMIAITTPAGQEIIRSSVLGGLLSKTNLASASAGKASRNLQVATSIKPGMTIYEKNAVIDKLVPSSASIPKSESTKVAIYSTLLGDNTSFSKTANFSLVAPPMTSATWKPMSTTSVMKVESTPATQMRYNVDTVVKTKAESTNNNYTEIISNIGVGKIEGGVNWEEYNASVLESLNLIIQPYEYNPSELLDEEELSKAYDDLVNYIPEELYKSDIKYVAILYSDLYDILEKPIGLKSNAIDNEEVNKYNSLAGQIMLVTYNENSPNITMYWPGRVDLIGREPHSYQDAMDAWSVHYTKFSSNTNWCEPIHVNDGTAYIFGPDYIRNNLSKLPFIPILSPWLSYTKFNYSVDVKNRPRLLIVSTESRGNGYKYIIDMYKNTYQETADVDKPYLSLLSAESVDGKEIAYNLVSKDGNMYFFTEAIPGSNLYILVTYQDINTDEQTKGIYSWRYFIDTINNTLSMPHCQPYVGVDKPKNKQGELVKLLSDISKWDKSMVQPLVVSLPVLGYRYVKGPSSKCNEVSHIPLSHKSMSLFRYDGCIKPQFVNPDDNYLYIKKCFPISEVSRTSRPLALVRYSKTHFEKLYPSIGYYPWNRHKLSMDGETIQVDNLSKYVQNSIFGQEYKWFNSSSVKLLQQNFALFITNNGFGIDPNTPNFSLEDLIIQTISEHYEVPKEDAEYILSLYEWTSDWDYISPTNVNRYKYYIKLSLK